LNGLHRDPVIPNPSGSAGSESDEGEPSLMREYFGWEPRKFLLFGAVLVGAIIITTVPYVLLVGYGKWSRDVNAAGQLMLAACPVGVTGNGAQPCAPNGNAYSGPGLLPAAQSAQAGRTRQYSCPSCGTVGLPAWTQVGQPICPSCGNLMSASALRGGLAPAAAP
jgi:hypothetical protein